MELPNGFRKALVSLLQGQTAAEQSHKGAQQNRKQTPEARDLLKPKRDGFLLRIFCLRLLLQNREAHKGIAASPPAVA